MLSAVNSDHMAAAEGGGVLLSSTQPQQAVILAPSYSFASSLPHNAPIPSLGLASLLSYGCWKKSRSSVLEFWHGAVCGALLAWPPSADVGIARGCHLLPRGLRLSQLLDKDLGPALCPHLSGAGTKQFSFKTVNFMSL